MQHLGVGLLGGGGSSPSSIAVGIYIIREYIYCLDINPILEHFEAQGLRGVRGLIMLCKRSIVSLISNTLGGVDLYIGSSDNGMRRYARALNRIQSGILGRDVKKFREVTLTDEFWRKLGIIV